MHVVTVQFQIIPFRIEEFLPLIRENAARSLADERGCIQFDVCVNLAFDRQSASMVSQETAGSLRRIWPHD